MIEIMTKMTERTEIITGIAENLAEIFKMTRMTEIMKNEIISRMVEIINVMIERTEIMRTGIMTGIDMIELNEIMTRMTELMTVRTEID